MRKTKRVIAMLLAIVLAVGGASGCGTKAGTEVTESTVTLKDRPDTWIADRTITVQAYVSDIGYSLPKDLDNTPVMQELTRRTGIKLKIQYTPGENDSSVMASHLASGTIPDVILTYLNDSTRNEFPLLLKAAKEEMFADIGPYLKDTQVFKKYLEDGYLPEDTRDNIMFRDDFKGSVYLIHLGADRVDRSLTFEPEADTIGGMYIQTSIANELGIDPREIRTQDQLYDLLVKIKEGGFKDDNGNDVFPLGPKYWGGSPDALNFVTRGLWWGVSDFYNMTEDGVIKHEAETDYVFKKIDYMRKLLDEGLVNPEFFTMDGTRAEEVSKTHNSAIIADVHNYMDVIYSSEDWLPVGPLNDFVGNDNKLIASGKRVYGAMAVSSKAANPEEIIKFFDYLSTYEGRLLCQYGVEGFSYNMVDGKIVLTDQVQEWVDNSNNDELINQVGAAFDNLGCVFFDYVLTDSDALADFGEARPGSSTGTMFKGAMRIAEYAPREYKLVEGLPATAYLSDESMVEIKAQMSLLNYKEMLTQAMFAANDQEVNKIVDSFRAQLKAAGVEEFKEFLKEKYDENPKSITFYNK